LAGFQVTLNGRFWVTPEARKTGSRNYCPTVGWPPGRPPPPSLNPLRAQPYMGSPDGY